MVFGKLRGAMSAVTGGGAKVSIEYAASTVFPGDPVPVKVTVVSTRGEIKSNGVYVDLVAAEEGAANTTVVCKNCHQKSEETAKFEKQTANQSFPLAGAFVLQPNETRVFEGTIQVPGGMQPSYAGPVARHQWQIRGRLDAFGNDPDSGFRSLRVGLRA